MRYIVTFVTSIHHLLTSLINIVTSLINIASDVWMLKAMYALSVVNNT